MIDFAARLKTIREKMDEQNIGMMFLRPSANLFYLTGMRHRANFQTDVNAYGDWAAGGYIGPNEGVTFTVPRMGSEYFIGEIENKPWFEQVRCIDESEEPLDVMREMIERFDLRGKKVALDDHAWAQTVLAFRRLLPETEYVMASDLVAPMRMIKSETELDLMRLSGQICDATFRKALERLRLGVTAWEVECEIDYQMTLAGADFNSFPTGVVFTRPSGGRELPTRRSERRLLPGDAITFDFGCMYQGYASDFGRCAFAGEPPDQYLRMHELVLGAQRAAMEAMKAGQLSCAQANAIARKVIEDGGYGEHFVHRLGHGIGVTVHEPPWLDVVEETVLQNNMTFTVEPSICIPDGYHNRVEDVVVVTEKGGVSLYKTDHRLYLVG
jgi:Xaa-Pro aminopeptidase